MNSCCTTNAPITFRPLDWHYDGIILPFMARRSRIACLPDDRLTRILKGPNVGVVAQAGTRVIGIGLCTICSNSTLKLHGRMCTLLVYPEYWDQHVATDLLEVIMLGAQQKHLRAVFASVYASDDHEAFYLRHGFRPYSVLQHNDSASPEKIHVLKRELEPIHEYRDPENIRNRISGY